MFWKEQTSLVVHLDLSFKTIIWLVQEVQGKLCRVCRIYFVMLLLCGHPLPETVFSPMLKNALRPSGVHLKLSGFILGCATNCLSVIHSWEIWVFSNLLGTCFVHFQKWTQKTLLIVTIADLFLVPKTTFLSIPKKAMNFLYYESSRWQFS